MLRIRLKRDIFVGVLAICLAFSPKRLRHSGAVRYFINI